jgi:hypothetical protein
MKRKIIYLGLLLLPLTFIATSCGDSGEAGDSDMHDHAPGDEHANDSDDPLFDYSDPTAAMDAYENLVGEYAELLEGGSVDEAAALKIQMDALYSYSEGEFGSEIEALAGLADMALDLEAGLDVDIESVLGSYGDALNALNALDGAGDALDALDAMGGAVDAMDAMGGAVDAMDALDAMGGTDALEGYGDALDALEDLED